MRKVIIMKIKSTEPTIARSLLIQFAKDRKISVKELAERTGLSYSHVVNILNGSRDITPKIITVVNNYVRRIRKKICAFFLHITV